MQCSCQGRHASKIVNADVGCKLDRPASKEAGPYHPVAKRVKVANRVITYSYNTHLVVFISINKQCQLLAFANYSGSLDGPIFPQSHSVKYMGGWSNRGSMVCMYYNTVWLIGASCICHALAMSWSLTYTEHYEFVVLLRYPFRHNTSL